MLNDPLPGGSPNSGKKLRDLWPHLVGFDAEKTLRGRESAGIETRLVRTSLSLGPGCLGVEGGIMLRIDWAKNGKRWNAAQGGNVSWPGVVANEGPGLRKDVCILLKAARDDNGRFLLGLPP